MAKIHGQHGVVHGGGVAVAHVQSYNVDIQAAALEGYSMGEIWADAETGIKKWSGSLECYYDPADAGQINLEAGSEVTVDFYPSGDGSGASYRTGTAIVTGEPWSASKDGWVMTTFNFMGKGALTTTTVA